MVTEKYPAPFEQEWNARRSMLEILEETFRLLRRGDVAAIGAGTMRNFHEPIQTIIPGPRIIILNVSLTVYGRNSGKDFRGFWMLGGMSGGGMGFIFAPDKKLLRKNGCRSSCHNKGRTAICASFRNGTGGL